jgi:hypothetical protein
VAGRTHNSPYTKIQELAKELKAISHPNKEQECLREILRSIALRTWGGKINSKQSSRLVSQRQDNQSQRRSTFDRLGPNGRATKETGETRIKAFGLNKQGKTEPGLLFLQILKTTLNGLTTGKMVELNLTTEKLEYSTGSLVLQTDFFSTATS